MPYRVAAVSFLNALPLIDRFLRHEEPKVELSRELPSRLAGLLSEDRADVALLPVVEVLAGVSPGILPGSGIACRGPVDSVKLFVHGDLGGIQRLRTDRGSRSSVALARVLLAEVHGVRPELVEVEPVPGALPEPGEASLVIGDRCLAFEAPFRRGLGAAGTVLDLGGAWFELTGLPFVFAAWAPARAFVDRATAADLAELTSLLTAAREDGWAHRREIAVREAALGRLGRGGEATAAAITYYFEQSLRYRLEDADLAGVARFRELGIEHGVLPAGTAPLELVR
jgi:chorismate dehydratase